MGRLRGGERCFDDAALELLGEQVRGCFSQHNIQAPRVKKTRWWWVQHARPRNNNNMTKSDTSTDVKACLAFNLSEGERRRHGSMMGCHWFPIHAYIQELTLTASRTPGLVSTSNVSNSTSHARSTCGACVRRQTAVGGRGLNRLLAQPLGH